MLEELCDARRNDLLKNNILCVIVHCVLFPISNNDIRSTVQGDLFSFLLICQLFAQFIVNVQFV